MEGHYLELEVLNVVVVLEAVVSTRGPSIVIVIAIFVIIFVIVIIIFTLSTVCYCYYNDYEFLLFNCFYLFYDFDHLFLL